jgi:hypothetical protein
MTLFAEMSAGQTVTLICAIVFIGMIWKLHKWKQNAKAAIGNAWTAANNSPMAGAAARTGLAYLLHRWLR